MAPAKAKTAGEDIFMYTRKYSGDPYHPGLLRSIFSMCALRETRKKITKYGRKRVTHCVRRRCNTIHKSSPSFEFRYVYGDHMRREKNTSVNETAAGFYKEIINSFEAFSPNPMELGIAAQPSGGVRVV